MYIWELIKQLVSSKKIQVLISGTVVTFLAKYKFQADPLIIQGLIAMVVAYLIGQGIADNGKEAAKIQAVASQAGQSTPATQAMARISDSVKAKT